MIRNALPAEEVLKRAHAIGESYGFVPFATLARERRDLPRAAPGEAAVLPLLDPTAESISNFLKQCHDTGVIPSMRQPLFVWHTNITAGRPAPKTAIVQFHAIGTDRAIADAVVIRAMHALAHDLSKSEPIIRINTLGDKETRARFARELGNFFKKRGTTLPEECITCAKRDVFEAALLAISKECAEDLPSPTDHLSDQSRKRFEELLDYLETTDTPYELAPNLLSRGTVWSETCFSILSEGKTLVWGSRYGDLARAHFKISMPATGAVLKIETEGASAGGGPASGGKVSPVKGPARLRFAFVHIGEEAKRESIKLAGELRRARLPLWQIIGLESLTEQMLFVEKMDPPYLLIMGRKEALEHSATLRNRATQEEIAIPLSELTARLKAFA
ncbi:MAG: His/Gly/Thr/Pro-type tRNA ligase C-terminal domain-containing protein [bacterium]|nr:His/Gly/Thr/Pro-type tRNA ligase C-terminal domain-containing protein [bacterium]